MKNLTKADIIKVSLAHGIVYTARNNYSFAYYKPNPNSYWIFMFDPKNQNMSLTNAAEEVICEVLDTLLHHNIIPISELELILDRGHFVCEDSIGEFAEVKLTHRNSGKVQAVLKYNKKQHKNIIYSEFYFKSHLPKQETITGICLSDIKEIDITAWNNLNMSHELLSLVNLLG